MAFYTLSNRGNLANCNEQPQIPIPLIRKLSYHISGKRQVINNVMTTRVLILLREQVTS